MAKPHERVFAFVAALLFLATSVAVAVVVVWQSQQQKKADQDALSGQTQTEPSTEQTINQPQEGALQGTKLKDFTPVSTVNELQIIDVQQGSGEAVKEGATVVAHYTGALAKDGIIFQSSHDGPNQAIEFGLNEVIAGWTKGVPGMKVGGVRRLVIPYAQAYGEAGRPDGGIPAKADLVFDIELVSVQQ